MFVIDMENRTIEFDITPISHQPHHPLQLDGNSASPESSHESLSKLPNSTEDDLLGSDLDDDDDDNEASIETDNIILCQYDKASRTKSKWKCSLKDGLVHVNGQDFAFHRAAGEFEWI